MWISVFRVALLNQPADVIGGNLCSALLIGFVVFFILLAAAPYVPIPRTRRALDGVMPGNDLILSLSGNIALSRHLVCRVDVRTCTVCAPEKRPAWLLSSCVYYCQTSDKSPPAHPCVSLHRQSTAHQPPGALTCLGHLPGGSCVPKI